MQVDTSITPSESHACWITDHLAGTMARLAGRRLLLVEDNELIQELMVDLLTTAAVQVVVAANGREALDVLSADQAFDWIFMDIQMPVMNGYTATRQIRKNPAFNSLPIIAMTANPMAETYERLLEAGMQGSIPKPVELKVMLGTLIHWCTHTFNHAAPFQLQHRVAAAAEASDGLPDLVGVDTTAGMANTMRNTTMYRRMLLKFRDGQRDFAVRFAAARQDPDPLAQVLCAHSLRGNAAIIGAKGVETAASTLEDACREGSDAVTISSLACATVAHLRPVIAGLEGLAVEETVPEEMTN